jgi:hypothetical protein
MGEMDVDVNNYDTMTGSASELYATYTAKCHDLDIVMGTRY